MSYPGADDKGFFLEHLSIRDPMGMIFRQALPAAAGLTDWHEKDEDAGSFPGGTAR